MKVILMAFLFFPEMAAAKILIIGDSAFGLTETVSQYLKEEEYDVISVSTFMADISEIEDQYYEYKKKFGQPNTIIFGAGGKDLLKASFNECLNRNNICQEKINSILNKIYGVIYNISADGVDRIIYVGLYHLQGDKSLLNPFIDIAMNEVSIACDVAPFDCRFVNPRPYFDQTAVLKDSIYLTGAGIRLLGKLISYQI